MRTPKRSGSGEPPEVARLVSVGHRRTVVRSFRAASQDCPLWRSGRCRGVAKQPEKRPVPAAEAPKGSFLLQIF